MLWKLRLLSSLVVIGYCFPAYAIKVETEDKESFLNINFLMQPFIQATYHKNAEPEMVSDIFIRRTRVLLGGKINKWVSFFTETDMVNLGKGRSFGQDLVVQDAMMKLTLHKAFNLNIGMFLPGFARDFFTSAGALHSFDYHGAMAPGLAYPGIGRGLSVWRDTGIQATGLFMEDKLEYRLSVTTGASNPDLLPRFTGRLSYNLFDAEGGYFPAATYLGKKKVVSLGVAFDVQPDGLAVNTAAPDEEAVYDHDLYMGVAADVVWDLPLAGDKRLTGQLGYILYRLGEENQMGLLFDTGVAFGKWEPMVAMQWVKNAGDEEFDQNFLGIHGGLNYWAFGQNANFKLDVGLLKPAGAAFDGDGMVIQTTLRTQLLF